MIPYDLYPPKWVALNFKSLCKHILINALSRNALHSFTMENQPAHKVTLNRTNTHKAFYNVLCYGSSFPETGNIVRIHSSGSNVNRSFATLKVSCPKCFSMVLLNGS